jgi:hypothetical protein
MGRPGRARAACCTSRSRRRPTLRSSSGSCWCTPIRPSPFAATIALRPALAQGRREVYVTLARGNKPRRRCWPSQMWDWKMGRHRALSNDWPGSSPHRGMRAGLAAAKRGVTGRVKIGVIDRLAQYACLVSAPRSARCVSPTPPCPSARDRLLGRGAARVDAPSSLQRE